LCGRPKFIKGEMQTLRWLMPLIVSVGFAVVALIVAFQN
jgi:hypothetical protein